MPEPDQQLDRDHLDLEYRQSYLRWVSSLSPVDRRQLIALGLDRPSVERATFVHARGEVFRDSPGMIETWLDDRGEGWHPGLPVEEDERDELPHLVNGIDPEAVRALIGFLVPDPGPRRWRRATLRLAILARWIDDSVREMTLDQLAADLAKSGIVLTKQRLSQMQLDLADALGADAPGGKTSHGREQYRQSAIRIWETRTTSKKAKAGVPGEGHKKITETAV